MVFGANIQVYILNCLINKILRFYNFVKSIENFVKSIEEFVRSML